MATATTTTTQAGTTKPRRQLTTPYCCRSSCCWLCLYLHIIKLSNNKNLRSFLLSLSIYLPTSPSPPLTHSFTTAECIINTCVTWTQLAEREREGIREFNCPLKLPWRCTTAKAKANFKR